MNLRDKLQCRTVRIRFLAIHLRLARHLDHPVDKHSDGSIKRDFTSATYAIKYYSSTSLWHRYVLSDSSCNQNTFSLRDREISRGISLVAQCPHDARCVHSLYPDRVAVAVIRNNAVVSIGVAWVHLHGGYWNYVIEIQNNERSHHTSY